MKIAVIGGGRWARTIASVLLGLPGRADRVTMHSPGNFTGLEAWASERAFATRLGVEKARPTFEAADDRPDAVIVANRVADHTGAASEALQNGIPVLVEKPVALSADEIDHLNRMAGAKGTFLATSHVMLFARYFGAYASATAELGDEQSLRFIWTDGAADIARGEAKSYDAAVTVFDDVLPHLLPMTGRLRFGDVVVSSIDVQRGGARLAIELKSDGRPVSLVVARNDEGRRRQIEVATGKGAAILDFSSEPGTIEIAGKRTKGDPLWESAPRPLASMLTAFLTAAEGASPDPRLSPKLAIATASLASAIRGAYLEHQAGWLEQRLGEPLDAALLYALAELSADGERSTEAVSQAWSAITDRAGLAAFLSRSPLRSVHQAK